ncbi:MAG: ATP-binding cassette domain-containing protein [Spirochaetes bacterium]|nr:ATP-binding cassette domain-containing protein [Spirochaetota bacterium]
MISVSNLTKKFGNVIAVNNISFTVRKGEITGLLGPNGAGKTTTMRILTGFLAPTSGIVSVGNYRIDENPTEVKRIVGYLPESVPIYGDLTVYDYLMFVQKLRGISPNGRLKQTAELCGILDVMDKKVGELSKGYRQRVGLAHALIHDPEVLILDEPTSGLDPNQIVEIRNIIKEIGKKKTVILSTHILPEVEATCERVIIINKGEIVQDGLVGQLKTSFGNETVVKISVKGCTEQELASALSSLVGVREVRRGEGAPDLVSVEVRLFSNTEIRPEIFRICVEKGWVLYEMKRESFALENIFRELTMGGES